MQIEAQFARFQEVLRAVRDIRGRQNVPPRKPIEFSVRCDGGRGRVVAAHGALFHVDGCRPSHRLGPRRPAAAARANVSVPGMEVFVDLADLIDVAAEQERNQQLVVKLDGLIVAKRKKLENQNFVARAPAAVVEGERAALKELEDQQRGGRGRFAAACGGGVR